jgi:hypothetical protein
MLNNKMCPFPPSSAGQPYEAIQVPFVLSTIDLHGSASTWVFNVVRELMIDAVSEARVLALYADEIGQVPDSAARSGRYLVIKSHHGSSELDAWLAAADARVVLSVRDPRDASVSMAQRFNTSLRHTVGWLANDCNRLLRLASQGFLLLRYEDRFFDDRGSIARLAQKIGLKPEPATVEAIFTRYRTEAVRAFAESLLALPPERLTQVGPFTMDRTTQILQPHIGDGRSGKWRELPASQQIWLTRLFKPFLDAFGYPAANIEI